MVLATRKVIFDAMQKLRFRITMKQDRCKLKKITCAPIIFHPMGAKRRTEEISPARL
ncbi:hypothetical protein [Rhizobium esperanzae]|uniref:Uncharacterized protein n=1 Tax=Rhizobium esperanzae TaxID=1967781 RepID=A0A7W6R3E9_9HYPH|nr:hypothetical protein [Rhizobium esperanzae]MBB4236104.1 hypothetical protein [Rhizobium esperanzae]